MRQHFMVALLDVDLCVLRMEGPPWSKAGTASISETWAGMTVYYQRGVVELTEKYAEIDEVIAYIHQHLYEPLSLEQLARYAAYSPYHFLRIFKSRVGLSPQYYISSLRLQKAKDLLLQTNLPVRDIALEIGQQSLGTFTTRFTERVGMTPSEFRQAPARTEEYIDHLRQINDWRQQQVSASPFFSVSGTIQAEIPFAGIIFIGLFAKPIPEGLPLYGTLLSSLGDFHFVNVQPGAYYLMATAVPWKTKATDVLLPYETLRTRSRTPIVVTGDQLVPHQQVMLYGPRLDDPPILISLPVLMNRFLTRIHSLSK